MSWEIPETDPHSLHAAAESASVPKKRRRRQYNIKSYWRGAGKLTIGFTCMCMRWALCRRLSLLICLARLEMAHCSLLAMPGNHSAHVSRFRLLADAGAVIDRRRRCRTTAEQVWSQFISPSTTREVHSRLSSPSPSSPLERHQSHNHK